MSVPDRVTADWIATLADTQLVMAAIFIGGLLLIPLLSKPRTAPAKGDAGAH